MEEGKSSPSIFRQALTVNKKPFPWLKAVLAGIASGLPILIMLLFNNLQYGLIAALGGFTYLYVFPIPYVLLAKKLAWVVLGISVSVFLGTILAPFPIISAITMGLIGATAFFTFGAFRFIGPSAIFFVLVFAMSTGMPIAPEEAFLRTGLVFLSGILSWCIAMSGWFFNPHGPEKNAVKTTYIALAQLVDALSTKSVNEAQYHVMKSMKDTSQTLASGYSKWHTSNLFYQLYELNNIANKIYLGMIETNTIQQPKELGEALRKIALVLESKDIESAAKHITLFEPIFQNEQTSLIAKEIFNAKDCLNAKSKTSEELHFTTPTIKRVFVGALNKNSIILINALRFGIFTFLAAFIAYEFHLNRSFWVPLSCAAVMSGATVIATFHRAIQRGLGTILGIIVASVLLAFHPSGYFIALFVFLLTFITELFIVKNYGLAALFFTPNALIMAEAGAVGDYSFIYFATTRLVDVIIGIAIGLIGVWLVGRNSASSRLPHLISKTIRSQAQVFFVVFSNKKIYKNYGKNIEFNKMNTNLTNLNMVFDAATGEIPKDKKALEYYWPIIHSLEEMAFLLEKSSRNKERQTLGDEKLAKILLVLEEMAHAADRKERAPLNAIPVLNGFLIIQDTLQQLRKNLMGCGENIVPKQSL
ncbi:uncharacterized membrane protein YccC [Ureibacillus xyleni]|uniref:Uncharacterized membrane protein YccC n=1 Tax=Ureibacillus xyleni TaxID=614648 RepID=A0A285SGY2_9BACL|nr:FUSC family protein [Ureibacillus xyleni]SOC05211.1 uncharacterized membrane protein YccC [Ureibacillus xyleni]